MAKTIPQLTDATTVNAADELIIHQGGITKRATGAELAKGLNTINGTVNVKDFGAVGDGLADDTAAIQAAIDSVTIKGGTVFLPSGIYRVSDSIVINGHVHLVGAAAGNQNFPQNDPTGPISGNAVLAGSWLQLANGTSQAKGWNDENRYGVVVIKYDNPNYTSGYVDRRRFTSLRYIGIDGNGSNNTGAFSCVTAVDAWNMRIESCNLRHARGCLISSFNDNFTNTNNYLIINNWLSGNSLTTKGINIISGDSQVFGNHVAGCQQGIFAGGGVNVSHNHVWGNRVGIFVTSAGSDAQIVTNYVYDNFEEGIVVSGVDNASTTDDADNVLICGNMIISNGVDSALASTKRVGVQIGGNSANICITGNAFSNRAGGSQEMQFGVRAATSNPTLLSLSGNTFNNLPNDVSFTSSVTIRNNPASMSSAVVESHVGTLLSSMRANGNNISSVRRFNFDTWGSVTTITGNTLPVNTSSLIALDCDAPVTIDTMTYTAGNGVPFVIVRNADPDTVTFTHSASGIRCANGTNVVLGQHEAAMFVHVSGNIWQQVGGAY